MNTCRQGTEHKTMTEVILCDAGNPSMGCSEMLFTTIRDGDRADLPGGVERAKNNLHNRLGFSWTEIDKQERQT